jgi:hypothetical protein
MQNKTKLQRFIHGIKLGIKLSLLPKPVENFHTNPLIRIFRVLGGLSFILLIGGFIPRGSLFFYIILPLAILQLLYILTISIIKFCYLIYLWRNKKLEVRNSPLDKIATFGLNLIACVKGTCVYGLSGGAALSLGLSIDELLLNYGREPIFRDALGNSLDKALNSLGYENPNSDINQPSIEAKKLKYKLEQLKGLNRDIDDIDSMSREVGANDSEIIREIKNDLKNKIEAEKRSIAESKSKILSQLEGKNPFNTKK